MALKTPRPQADYRCTQEELYLICLLGWDSYLENVIDFTNTNTTYTVVLGQTNRAAVIAAKELPDFQARDEAPETLLILMKGTADSCLINWKLLEMHIEKSFPENLYKPKLEAAGADYYEGAGDGNWKLVSALMQSGKQFIAANTVNLTAGGMPAGFPLAFNGARSDFELLYTQFKDAEQDAEEARDTKINANNAIFHTVSAMFKDGQKIYRDNAAKRERFTFSRVLDLVSGGGSSTVTEVVWTLNLTGPQTVTFELIAITAAGGTVNFSYDNGVPESTFIAGMGVYTPIIHFFDTGGVHTVRMGGDKMAVGEIRSNSDKVISWAFPSDMWPRNITGEDNQVSGFSLPATFTGMMVLKMKGNNFNEVSVNNVLIQMDNNGLLGGYIDLSGGTNAAPTGAGLVAKNNLIGKGWTVITN